MHGLSSPLAQVALALLVIATAACGADDPHAVTPDAAVDAPTADQATPPDGTMPTDLPSIDGPITYATWPAEASVAVACAKNAFGANLSGLVYEPATATSTAILWAIQNEPSKLYRLIANGSTFTQVNTDGWITGKLLHYPDGTGSPDSEGLTRTDWTSNEIYVVAERDNNDAQVPRQSILRYELGGTKGVLDATHEWVLTADLPAADVNNGLEGIAWIPDNYLVQRGFLDESKQVAYDPALYPDHGTGIFMVGYDASGMLYGYVLDHQAGTFTRVATLSSGQSRAVDLSFDRELGTLWSLCDNGCKGRMTLLDVDSDASSPTAGRFVVRAMVSPPKALADMNNEGIALAPLAECAGDTRSFFWSDDEETNGYAIRRGLLSCARLY